MFDWKQEYSCNVSEIDNQHKKLFELAAELYEIANRKDDYDHYDEIKQIFKKLSDYTVYHFDYEEKLMDKHQFDAREILMHKLEHGAFVKKMIKIQNEDLDKNQQKVLMDIIMFVVDWIEKHILNTDKKYTQHFNAKGVF